MELRKRDSGDWSVELPADGAWRLDIRYRAAHELARRRLGVDALCQGDVLLPGSAGKEACVEVATLQLQAGPHVVAVNGDWGAADILGLQCVAARERATPALPFSLNSPDASRQARQVMAYLKTVHGQGILTGQHTGMAAGGEIRYLENQTGRRPALRGFDLLGYSSAVMPPGMTHEAIEEVVANRGSVEEAIRWWKDRCGLVSVCWHWYSPLAGRDKAFYTKNTDFDFEAALIPGTPGHEGLVKDMDLIAGQLGRLRDEGVPVLWRPLHEADGGWFWWGARGAEPYKVLYRWMHERFTVHHALNNLIWVWNAPAPDWYPGDDVVDLAGSDTYAPAGNHGPLTASYDLTFGLAGGRKPVALSENGPIPDMDELTRSRTPWLWYMTWAGMAMDEKMVPLEHLRRVYRHPYAVTSDRLPAEIFEYS